MSLRVRLSEDITHAMKSQGREREQLAVLRLLLAAVKNEEIAIQVRTEGLTDEQMIAVVRREVKKRRDAVAMYRQHGEETRAAAEESEMKVLENYLPAAPGVEAIHKVISDIVRALPSEQKNIGMVMKAAMQQLKGAVDGQVVRKMVEEALKEK